MRMVYPLVSLYSRIYTESIFHASVCLKGYITDFSMPQRVSHGLPFASGTPFKAILWQITDSMCHVCAWGSMTRSHVCGMCMLDSWLWWVLNHHLVCSLHVCLPMVLWVLPVCQNDFSQVQCCISKHWAPCFCSIVLSSCLLRAPVHNPYTYNTEI